jgi:hypothetical protein
LHFDKSTTLFRTNTFVSQLTPPLEQYLNLLKSIWIYEQIQEKVLAGGHPESDSHWPSFVKQLKHVGLYSQRSRLFYKFIDE